MRLIAALIMWLLGLDRPPEPPRARARERTVEEEWDYAYASGTEDVCHSLYGPDPRAPPAPPPPEVKLSAEDRRKIEDTFGIRPEDKP